MKEYNKHFKDFEGLLMFPCWWSETSRTTVFKIEYPNILFICGGI
jgi:hypothetical protein